MPEYLSNIFKEHLLYGIDQSVDQAAIINEDEEHRAAYATHCMDRLVGVLKLLDFSPLRTGTKAVGEKTSI